MQKFKFQLIKLGQYTSADSAVNKIIYFVEKSLEMRGS